MNAKVPNFEREYSSAGLEHLPYKQRVLGSNPCTPTNKRSDCESGRFFLFISLLRVANPFHHIGNLDFHKFKTSSRQKENAEQNSFCSTLALIRYYFVLYYCFVSL